MYGLINRSIEGLITARFGADRWRAVRARAGLADEPFVSMRSYDDSVTYALVGAAVSPVTGRLADRLGGRRLPPRRAVAIGRHGSGAVGDAVARLDRFLLRLGAAAA